MKAQERAKPRTGSIKRPRSSDEYSYLSKRQKPNETSQELKLGENLPELNRGAAQFIHDDITMDVNARLESRAADKLKDIGSSEYMKPPSVASISPTHRNAEEKGPSDSPARDEDAAETSKVAPTAGDSLVSPPTSHLDDMDGIANQGHATQVLSVNGGHIQERQIEVNTPASTSPKLPHPTIPEVTTASGESAELNEIHAPDTVEHKPISSHAGPSPKPTKPSSRPSSSHKSKQSMTTKESKHTHPVVESKGSSVRGRHDASPTSPQRPSKQVKRDRVSFSEVDADAESLKLIKEIQEQEFGLRRRTARS